MVKRIWGRNGSDNNEVVSVVERKITEVGTEMSAEVQAVMSMMKRYESLMREMLSEVETVKNTVKDISAEVLEMKGVNHIGKKPVLLAEVTAEVGKMTVKEIRSTIHGAARKQPTGYNAIYLKVRELTGVDIFAVGKIRVTPTDGLGFVDNNETYINALFKKGVQKQAAAIALDTIRNK